MRKLTTWSLAVFIVGCIAAVAFAGQSCEEQVPNHAVVPDGPEWVVIFAMTRKAGEPLMEFRVLIHAMSEGEAVMKSTLLINKTFGVNAIELLEFKEAARAKEEKK